MSPQRSGEYSEIASIMQSILDPLITKLDTKIDRLEIKVNHLSEDRVTRADIEKLRSELQATMVPRDSYEARHAALIQRDTEMEARFKKHEDDAQVFVQKLYEKFEGSNRDLENKFKEHKREINEELKEQQNTQLSDKDRHWIRLNQFVGIIAVIIALLSMILDHVRLQ